MHRRWGIAGPICRCSALCVVVGLSLPRTRRRWWAHLSSFGAMCRRRAILVIFGLSLGPYSSSLVGPFIIIGSWSGPTHRLWNVTGFDLFLLGQIQNFKVKNPRFSTIFKKHAEIIVVTCKVNNSTSTISASINSGYLDQNICSCFN